LNKSIYLRRQSFLGVSRKEFLGVSRKEFLDVSRELLDPKLKLIVAADVDKDYTKLGGNQLRDRINSQATA
jgi:hypothetical protein